MSRVLIRDFGRRFRSTGYGQLVRMIAYALHQKSEHDVLFEDFRGLDYDAKIPRQDFLNKLEKTTFKKCNYDAILYIQSPSRKITRQELLPNCPIILYTQNALGGSLIREWQECISLVDKIIVPGKFDQDIFSKCHDNVRQCPQIVDYEFFKPMPQYRKEGNEKISFYFVGSFSYRKGVDLIGQTFKQAFSNEQPIHLHMHCYSGLEGSNINKLLELRQELPKNVELTLYSGSLSPEWMRRKLNRFDSVFTLSRGEGWCMPLWESLFSGIPVIAPNSTAMGEYLPNHGVLKFGVNEKLISEINSEFGGGFKSKYGESGITMFEPDVDQASKSILDAYTNIRQLKIDAESQSKILRDQFSFERIASILSNHINDAIAEKKKNDQYNSLIG